MLSHFRPSGQPRLNWTRQARVRQVEPRLRVSNCHPNLDRPRFDTADSPLLGGILSFIGLELVIAPLFWLVGAMFFAMSAVVFAVAAVSLCLFFSILVAIIKQQRNS